MKWVSAIAKSGSVRTAVEEATAAISAQLGEPPDLVIVFASAELSFGDDVAARVHRRFPDAVVVGASAGGVIGNAHEEEDLPALSLTAARLPGVLLTPFHVDTAQLPSGARSIEEWHTTFGVPPDGRPSFLLFTDPFTCDSASLVDGMDRAWPGSAKVGGLASGGRGPGGTRLFLGGTTWRSGAVGVALKGRLRMDTVVAQGCRPIGTPMLVTRCEGQLIRELNQQKPVEVLRELHQTLSTPDQELFKSSLLLGVEMSGDKVEYGQGDFLVRNIVGVEQRTGSLAVAAELQQFQAVQFMVRDAAAAEQDLAHHLSRYRDRSGLTPPSGALLFSCRGRGRRLFGREDHDTGLFQEVLGTTPLGGFFCNGEIGPVGGSTFLHGYTSAFAIFHEE